jgi:outer membrane protein TolC
MHTISMGTHVGLVVLVASFLGLLILTHASAQENQPELLLKAAEAKKLLKDRQEALADALQLQIRMFKEGKVGFDTVANIERSALRASLDWSATAEERIATLIKLSKVASDAHDIADARFKAGIGNKVDVQVAKAMVLEVKLELLRCELDRQAATQIQALKGTQYELLKKAAAQLVAQYEAGTVDVARLTQAGQDFLRASAEGNERPGQRLARLQACETFAKKTLDIAEAKSKGGLVAEVDVLQARSFLLEVQIEQLRAEARAAGMQ